jgi:hypothetical protein
MAQIIREIVGHIEIKIAIVVNVYKGGTNAPAPVGNSRVTTNLFELSVSKIVKEKVAAVAGDIDILPTIVIDIGGCNSHSPTARHHASRDADITKMPFAVALIQKANKVSTLAELLYRTPTHEQNVEVAVTVEIQERGSSTHRFDDVFLGRAPLYVEEICQPGFSSDIDEDGMSRLRRGTP